MFFLRFSILILLLSCGGSDYQPRALTDTKSVLLYQHVQGENFRLLVCPYEVNLDVESDCRSVFYTPEGQEYSFSSTPRRPLFFAPTQDTVRKIAVVPIVVGTSVLSFLALKKLRTKRTPTRILQEMEQVVEILGREAKELVQKGTSWRKGAYNDQIMALSKNYSQGPRGAKKIMLEDAPPFAKDTMPLAAYRKHFQAEMEFMSSQFELMADTAAGFVPPQTSQVTRRYLFRMRPELPRPQTILDKYRAKFASRVAKADQALDKADKAMILKRDTAIASLRNAQQTHDEIIAGFFRDLAETIDAPAAFNRIRKNQHEFRRQTSRQLRDYFTEVPDNISHYIISAIAGLFAVSHAPIPALDKKMFTAQEWNGLFAKDGFKSPRPIPDSYSVVKKLARYLKSRDIEVRLDEQAFFGLKS